MDGSWKNESNLSHEKECVKWKSFESMKTEWNANENDLIVKEKVEKLNEN